MTYDYLFRRLSLGIDQTNTWYSYGILDTVANTKASVVEVSCGQMRVMLTKHVYVLDTIFIRICWSVHTRLYSCIRVDSDDFWKLRTHFHFNRPRLLSVIMSTCFVVLMTHGTSLLFRVIILKLGDAYMLQCTRLSLVPIKDPRLSAPSHCVNLSMVFGHLGTHSDENWIKINYALGKFLQNINHCVQTLTHRDNVAHINISKDFTWTNIALLPIRLTKIRL